MQVPKFPTLRLCGCLILFLLSTQIHSQESLSGFRCQMSINQRANPNFYSDSREGALGQACQDFADESPNRTLLEVRQDQCLFNTFIPTDPNVSSAPDFDQDFTRSFTCTSSNVCPTLDNFTSTNSDGSCNNPCPHGQYFNTSLSQCLNTQETCDSQSGQMGVFQFDTPVTNDNYSGSYCSDTGCRITPILDGSYYTDPEDPTFYGQPVEFGTETCTPSDNPPREQQQEKELNCPDDFEVDPSTNSCEFTGPDSEQCEDPFVYNSDTQSCDLDQPLQCADGYTPDASTNTCVLIDQQNPDDSSDTGGDTDSSDSGDSGNSDSNGSSSGQDGTQGSNGSHGSNGSDGTDGSNGSGQGDSTSDGEEEGDGDASSSADCQQLPSCSGDATQCAILRQIHESNCNIVEQLGVSETDQQDFDNLFDQIQEENQSNEAEFEQRTQELDTERDGVLDQLQQLQDSGSGDLIGTDIESVGWLDNFFFSHSSCQSMTLSIDGYAQAFPSTDQCQKLEVFKNILSYFLYGVVIWYGYSTFVSVRS